MTRKLGRLFAVGLTILGIGVFGSLIRIGGYTPDRRPVFVWRWEPDVADQTAEPIPPKAREAAMPSERIVDLRATTSRDFPSFRGADRSGEVRGVRLARDWKENPPKLLWRHRLEGGLSSFAVVGDFCVTQEQRGEDEVVVCYELQTGKECWAHHDRAKFVEYWGGAGPRATPTVQDGRVYALGATGILNCLDGRNGSRLWSVNILEDNEVDNRIFGMTASPLVVNDLVVVSPGCRGSYTLIYKPDSDETEPQPTTPTRDRSLVAYDARTGRRVWAGGDGVASDSSPLVADLAGRRQILIFNGDGLFAHDPADGRVLWSHDWVTNPPEKNNVCQPVPVPAEALGPTDAAFLASGYGKGCSLLDVEQVDGRFQVRERWHTRSLSAKFTSVVRRGRYIYGLDERILVCVDLSDGRRVWKKGSYGHGQVLLLDDLLLISSDSGEIALVEATPQAYRELGRFEALHGRTWNHPALSGPYLLVRNDSEVACYELALASRTAGPPKRSASE